MSSSLSAKNGAIVAAPNRGDGGEENTVDKTDRSIWAPIVIVSCYRMVQHAM